MHHYFCEKHVNPGEVYMQYKFSNVFITNIKVTLEKEIPMETLEINFTKVEMAHLRQRARRMF